MIVEALHEGMVVDRTAALGERDLFRGRQRLVAEEHHEVLEPSGFDLGKRRLVDDRKSTPPISAPSAPPTFKIGRHARSSGGLATRREPPRPWRPNLSLAQFWIQGIPQGIAEEVDAEDRQDDRDTWEDGDPRRR
jgi:hypothetical protein